MSDADRQRWNQRYAQPDSAPPSAAAVLADNPHLLPANGRALDLACGRGGNALLLARQGLVTDAWDIADSALRTLQQQADAETLALATRQVDLDNAILPEAHYAVICVSGYLQRALCPAIIAALEPGGLLFYQTFTREKALPGGGPSNPDYLLAPGELRQLFNPLRLLVYREEGDAGDRQRGLRNQAYLIGQRIT